MRGCSSECSAATACRLTVAWTGTTGPSVTRRYNGFRELADEGGLSRIWGGIHFRFETLASFGACTRLADYAADDVLYPR